MKRAALLVLLGVGAGAAAPAYGTPDASLDDTQRTVASALVKGAFDDALARLDEVADRGEVHPDLSWNRAVALTQRAASPQAAPGDLGRAMAALLEVKELRAGDPDVDPAIEALQRELARRRTQRSGAPDFSRPTFGRAIVQLAAEDTWAGCAALAALLTAGALLARFISRDERTRFSAGVVAGLTSCLLALCGALTYFARAQRLHAEPAVVVVAEAPLLDAAGQPAASGDLRSLPEGSSVDVTERRGALAHVEWPQHDAWVNTKHLYALARP